MRKFYNLPIF